ncbi:NADP-dependent aldehyde dehydrogenase [Nocardioides thalensis]|uniref:NADP-dependent aldehyde dehydrogenase n=1 Tax=Nocardioides thalensis TaxID=1914755 RepID=A0A853C784_9ACTN|nr:NADP-dependent aldehyde dehydrogenase [Nocardioides thalensis]
MSITSYDPRTGAAGGAVEETSPADLAAAVHRAQGAAAAVAAAPPAERRGWLHAVADALEAHADELAALADRETALGLPRLTGEVARAAAQLRFYGDVAAEGSFLGVTIDEATDTTPRLVRVNRPIGPVAVFGASNFPFAFSVLGNDTGAALAAGCPVVAKAHPAHPELSARQVAIARAALDGAGAPGGAFDVVVGHQAGVDLVQAPEIAAVAFTGSQAGGLALWQLANQRDVVIPVFAEMGTVNPVVVTRDRVPDIAAIAEGFVGSFTLGHGQFCTKPGLLLAPSGSGAAEAVASALRSQAPAPVMLTEPIADSVRAGIDELTAAGAEVVAGVGGDGTGWTAPAAVLAADVTALKPGSRLLEECFGAVVLVVEYATDDELRHAIAALQGSLAATVVADDAQDPQAAWVLDALSHKAGRVTVNDWPTGVAFTWAQQHGGPWPSTTAPAATSVGAHGLDRFVRPVTFQSAEDSWLPAEARADNPWRLPRRVDGRLRTAEGGLA